MVFIGGFFFSYSKEVSDMIVIFECNMVFSCPISNFHRQ